jgi:hypothetical protein
MANNANAPYGLRPSKSNGAGETRVNYYSVSSASARIYEGDIVELSSGLVIKTTATVPTSLLLGVAARGTGAISAQIDNFPVYDDPGTRFLAQVNNGTSAVAASNFGTRCGLVQGTGDSTSNLSAVAVDAATTSTSYPVLVLRRDLRADNALGAYTECEVKLMSSIMDDDA